MNQIAIQQIISLHEWESVNLPLFKKSIGQSVVMRLVEAFIRGESLSVKELTLSLPYSASGIRLQLRMLENERWIEVIPSPEDQRVKVIQPSDVLSKAIESYTRKCVSLWGN